MYIYAPTSTSVNRQSSAIHWRCPQLPICTTSHAAGALLFPPLNHPFFPHLSLHISYPFFLLPSNSLAQLYSLARLASSCRSMRIPIRRVRKARPGAAGLSATGSSHPSFWLLYQISDLVMQPALTKCWMYLRVLVPDQRVPYRYRPTLPLCSLHLMIPAWMLHEVTSLPKLLTHHLPQQAQLPYRCRYRYLAHVQPLQQAGCGDILYTDTKHGIKPHGLQLGRRISRHASRYTEVPI